MKVHKKGLLFLQKSSKPSFLAEVYKSTIGAESNETCSQFTPASWNVVQMAFLSPKKIIIENYIKPRLNFRTN